LINKKIHKEDFIIGQKFVEISDIIFSANLPNKNFYKFNNENFKIISQNNHLTSFKIKNFKIKSGDVIFCSSNNLEILFYYLKKVDKNFNLTLISGQSDRKIDKNIISKKPECIYKWYSTNVDFNKEFLIPIPLGIANDYSPKNVRADDFLNYTKNTHKKENKLYINLQKNTNLKERDFIYESFQDKDWVIQKEPNLTIEKYLNDLNIYKFVLCPWGNGFDTHRFWEVLYSGSIPVTKYHTTYSSYKHLPIIFVEDFSKISLDFLVKKSNEIDLSNLQELNFKYWRSKIFNSVIVEESLSTVINQNKAYEFFYWNKKRIIYKSKSKLKIINFYLNKFKKFF